MDQLATVGNRILEVMLVAGFWISLIAGTGMTIKCLTKGDVHGAVKIVLMYVLAYACLFMLPWGLRMVREVFGNSWRGF